MFRLFSSFLCLSFVAGELSETCSNETSIIQQNAEFAAENVELGQRIAAIDQTQFCYSQDLSDEYNIYCNMFYNQDFANNVGTICNELGGDYEEIGLLITCDSAVGTGTKPTVIRIIHHEVPSCTGVSCSPGELLEYSETYFDYLEFKYTSAGYSCTVEWHDPMDDASSAATAPIVLALSSLFLVKISI